MKWLLSLPAFLLCIMAGRFSGSLFTRRRQLLQQLRFSFILLEHQIRIDLSPLPWALAVVSRTAAEPVSSLFHAVAAELSGAEPFETVWRRQLVCFIAGTPLGNEEQMVLMRLGPVLGRGDEEQQHCVLQEVIQELQRLTERASDEERRLVPLFQKLGALFGAFWMVILL